MVSILDRIDLGETQAVLFVGFGRGDEISRLSDRLKRDATIHGVEIDPSLVEIARKRLSRLPQKLELRTAMAQCLPYESGSMDLVFCKIVLSEIPDWEQAIAEMARVLKPSGRLILIDFVSYRPDWLTISKDAHPGFDIEVVIRELRANEMRVLQRKDAAGKGTIGSLDGERLWVETFFMTAVKENEND